MLIPQPNYILDEDGQKAFVQIPLQQWEDLLFDLKTLESTLVLKEKLKNALMEVREINSGKKTGTPFNEFLNEL